MAKKEFPKFTPRQNANDRINHGGTVWQWQYEPPVDGVSECRVYTLGLFPLPLPSDDVNPANPDTLGAGYALAISEARKFVHEHPELEYEIITRSDTEGVFTLIFRRKK